MVRLTLQSVQTRATGCEYLVQCRRLTRAAVLQCCPRQWCWPRQPCWPRTHKKALAGAPARSMAGDGRVVLWTLAKAELQHQEVLELAEGGGCDAPGAAAAAAGAGPEDGADDLAHPLLAAGTCFDFHRVRGRARARARARPRRRAVRMRASRPMCPASSCVSCSACGQSWYPVLASTLRCTAPSAALIAHDAPCRRGPDVLPACHAPATAWTCVDQDAFMQACEGFHERRVRLAEAAARPRAGAGRPLRRGHRGGLPAQVQLGVQRGVCGQLRAARRRGLRGRVEPAPRPRLPLRVRRLDRPALARCAAQGARARRAVGGGVTPAAPTTFCTAVIVPAASSQENTI